MTTHTAPLGQRAALAIALMVGFYVLALSIAFGLLWIPYAEWTYLDRIHPKLALVCIVSAGAIIWAIAPRPDKFEPPGLRLTERSQPDLFKLIRDVSIATKQEMPAEVYLVNEVNAWVTHRGGIMGFRSQRVMGIGLPLLQGLTVSEFKAVIAHEFGHYAAGDVKLGPWIYKTRAAIGRALASLGESWLAAIFNVYGRLFLGLTLAISRQQEFAADALAARTVSAAAMISALRRTEGLDPAFDSYWKHEVAPALNAGFLPPLATGFEKFLGVDAISSALTQMVTSAEARGQSGKFDSHPPLRERLAALAGIRTRPQPNPDPPASTLMRDLDGQARAVLEFVAGHEACSKLRRIEWEQLATTMYPEGWRESTKEFSKFLAPFTAATIPAGEKAFLQAGLKLKGAGEDGGKDVLVARACDVFASAVAVALLDSGCVPETGPGRPLVFSRGTIQMEPFTAIRQLAKSELTAEAWQAQCHAIGIAGRPLGAVAQV
jgi:heat shock protein HtpX